MKKTAILLLIFTLLVVLVSCRTDTENKEIDTTESSYFDDVETEKISEKEAKREKINEKLTALYTQNNEDIFLLQDDQVYKYGIYDSIDYYDDIRFQSESPYISGKEFSYTGKYHILSPEKNGYICEDESCQHNDIWCLAAEPAKASQHFPLKGSDGAYEVIYSVGLMYKSMLVDGVAWSNPVYHSYEDDLKFVMFETNLKSGTKKAVAVGIPQLFPNYYYNGYILGYCSDFVTTGDGESEILYQAVSVNTQTGEWKKFDSVEQVGIVDIVDGCVYILDTDGNLYRSDPFFDNVEFVKTINYTPETEKTDMCLQVSAKIIDDQLYYLSDYKMKTYTASNTDGSEYTSECFLADLYVTNINDKDSQGKLIAEDVISMWESDENKKLYFTTWDYKYCGMYSTPNGSLEASTKCNGTLRSVDAMSGEISVVFEDCGGDVSTVNIVTDNMIVFSGMYYSGVDKGHEYGVNSCASYFKYDMNTGEITLLYNIVE